MNALPSHRFELWSAAQAAAADRHTIEALGIPSVVLMERASLAVAHELLAMLAGASAPVVALVGPGNNGGDALATARIVAGWGLPAEAVVAVPAKGVVAEQLERARRAGVVIHDGLPPAPARAVVVDGLLGTGARGAPRGAIESCLAWQEAIRGPRIAIDVPSGVDVDSGAVEGRAFRADLTVTFARSKPGLHVTPGRDHAGRVVIAHIGVEAAPEAGLASSLPCALVGPQAVAAATAAFSSQVHKFERGHVAIVGGGRDTPGAPILAATTALRAGAGVCTIVGGGAELRALLAAQRPELMVSAWTEGPPLPRAHALVVGPGLTDRDVDASRLANLYADDPRPAVWDASALEHIPLGQRPAGPRILTPHPGEAARMLQRLEPSDPAATSARVQGARLAVARRLAEASGAIVVLKGGGSIIADPAGQAFVAIPGGPALATAGSGDCLAGLLGALLARGVGPVLAACGGVHVHGLAGDRAASRRPLPLAGDLADAVGEILGQPAELGAEPWPGYRWA